MEEEEEEEEDAPSGENAIDFLFDVAPLLFLLLPPPPRAAEGTKEEGAKAGATRTTFAREDVIIFSFSFISLSAPLFVSVKCVVSARTLFPETKSVSSCLQKNV